MSAPDDLLYEYAVIRYVPRVEREEFVNIGLLMMNKRNKWLRGMIWLDESRIKALYGGSDLNQLKNQCRIFEMKDVPGAALPIEEKYRWLASVKSASIQVSPSHPGMLGTLPEETPEREMIKTLMDKEFERLFQCLIL